MNKETLFQIQNLSKTYTQQGRKISALSDVTLSIENGDIYGIIGMSGAGKSTLIRCLAGLIAPSSGQILFHKEDLALMRGPALRAFHRRVGMIFQHFNLLSSRTVAENISYPLEIAGVGRGHQNARIEELLSLVGLQSKRGSYPAQLSGGEKQRVGIARALATRPEVLLCDEATSSLDPKTSKEILKLLKTLHKELGLTIILITHEMEVVKLICNRVAVIENGRIIEEGAVVEVFSDPKQMTTKQFLQKASHEIPPEFLKTPSPHQRLLRLKFKGSISSEPIISEIVRRFHVDANILMGWIDRLQTLSIGTLIIELTGSPDGIQNALRYLEEKGVHYEVITHGT